MVPKPVELAAKKVGPKPTFLFQAVEAREKVLHIVEPVLAERGVELVDVEFRREGQGQVLRVLVDQEGGIDLDSLSRLSRELSDLLDVADVGPGRYTLEVSSPGIDRPLRKPEHFVRYIGKRIRLRSAVPLGERRNFVGTLTAVTAGGVTLTVPDGPGTEVYVPYSNIEKANYEHEFSPADFRKSPGGGSSR